MGNRAQEKSRAIDFSSMSQEEVLSTGVKGKIKHVLSSLPENTDITEEIYERSAIIFEKNIVPNALRGDQKAIKKLSRLAELGGWLDLHIETDRKGKNKVIAIPWGPASDHNGGYDENEYDYGAAIAVSSDPNEIEKIIKLVEDVSTEGLRVNGRIIPIEGLRVNGRIIPS